MAPTTGPETPQAAAMSWVEAVVSRGDLLAAWPHTDPVLRLVLAQDWVWNNRHDPAIGHGHEESNDWERIARGLAATPPDHPLWDRFAADLVAMWARTWKGFGPTTWHVTPQPEILALDLEVVTFVERGTAFTRRFAMRHTPDGWLVASVNGEHLFEPGWPPRLDRPAGQP